MIGLDTNILVRFLTRDDPAQWRTANRIIAQELNEDSPGFVSVVVVAETAWVLKRTYRYSTAEIVDAFDALLSMPALRIEEEQQVYNAILLAASNGADVADALIGALALDRGCSHTLTFDMRAARLPGFALAT